MMHAKLEWLTNIELIKLDQNLNINPRGCAHSAVVFILGVTEQF